jgi:hypothetical protein
MDENFYNALQGLQQFQEQTSEAREEAIEKSTEKFNTIKEKALDATEPVSTFAEGIMAHTIASKLGLSKEAAEALAKGDIKGAAKQMGNDAMNKVKQKVNNDEQSEEDVPQVEEDVPEFKPMQPSEPNMSYELEDIPKSNDSATQWTLNEDVELDDLTPQESILTSDPEAITSSVASRLGYNPESALSGGLRGDSTIARALGQSSRTAEELAETSEQTLADISTPVQQATSGVVDSLAAGTQNLLTQGASLLNKVADIGKPAADLAGDVGKSVAADLGEELPVEGGLDLLGPAGWLVGAGLALAPIFVNLFDKPHHKALPKLPIENIAVQSGIVG